MANPNPYDFPEPRFNAGLLRDLLAVALMILGAAGLLVAAFFTDWRLGVATLSVEAMTVGAVLGYRR